MNLLEIFGIFSPLSSQKLFEFMGTLLSFKVSSLGRSKLVALRAFGSLGGQQGKGHCAKV